MKAFGTIVVCVLGIALIVELVRAYVFYVNVPGLSGKNLWDWLQLLIVPAALAIGGFWLNQIQKNREGEAADLRTIIEHKAADSRAETEHDIASDNQCEAALQGYLNKMSELLLHENLRKSEPDDEVRKIARVLTLTACHRLDGWRKRNVLEFLQESGLIDKDKNIVNLVGADLRRADLRITSLSGANLSSTIMGGADLRFDDLSRTDLRFAFLGEARLDEAHLDSANLSGARLPKASLREADLSGADLTGANLTEADLTGANLTEVLLSHADLTGAKVTTEQLDKASSLKGATMPDGSQHP